MKRHVPVSLWTADSVTQSDSPHTKASQQVTAEWLAAGSNIKKTAKKTRSVWFARIAIIYYL